MRTSLRCAVQVRIEGLSEAEAASVREALEPDNVRIPKGLDVAVTTGGKDGTTPEDLIMEFAEEEEEDDIEDGKTSPFMGHLVGTVDEVLEHAQVALRVINGA